MSWVVKAFVLATEISGPACVYSTPFERRGIDASTTLQTDSTLAPAARASSTAASVSAVSPDCDTAISSVFGPRDGFRWRTDPCAHCCNWTACNTLEACRQIGYPKDAGCFQRMMQFWNGRLPFRGWITHWDYSKAQFVRKAA